MAVRDSKYTISVQGVVAWVEFEGHFGGAEVRDFLNAFRLSVNRLTGVRYVVGDTSGVLSTSADIHMPSQEVLTYFKTAGIEELIIVMPNPVLSMIVRTTAFVARLPALCLPNRFAAHEYVMAKTRPSRRFRTAS